ncbi:MAG: flagellar motor switch protein FliN [Chitinispirillales bacterium]|nr:flagellar motor switch protein FliN [Chitinispirillales bacterium]
MSNFLSQEEIDSLLNNIGSEDESEGSGERYKVLTPIFELFCKNAGSVLGTNAGTKTLNLTSESYAKADFDAAKEKVGSDVLLLTLPVMSGNADGDMYLIMRKNDAATLANLMMMVEELAEYNPADSDDAISELFNQVMGAFCTALGADLGESASAGNATVAVFDMANPPFDGNTADMGLAKLSVDGMFSSGIALIIPTSFGDEIVAMKTPKAPSMMEMGIGISQSEMDQLTTMASSSSGSAGGASSFGAPASSFGPPPPHAPRVGGYTGPKDNIDLLLDIELDINIELGKSELTIKKILELAPGSIVELDKMAGEPVDLIVNNKVVAKGEVVVVDENFGIRVVSLVSAEDRIKSLK